DVFFFSSRRRHTRSKRDWSSDVCSSDLLHDVQLRDLWILSTAIGELTWQTAQVRRGLAAYQFTRLTRCHTRLRGRYRLVDDGLGFRRVRIKPVIKVLINRALHKAFDLRVAQLGLGLAFEQRISNL